MHNLSRAVRDVARQAHRLISMRDGLIESDSLVVLAPIASFMPSIAHSLA